MHVKIGVVVQPPECGLREDDEPRAGLPKALEFPNSRLIIGRSPPVLAVFFQERYWAAVRKRFVGQLRFIDKNEGASGRNQFRYFSDDWIRDWFALRHDQELVCQQRRPR